MTETSATTHSFVRLFAAGLISLFAVAAGAAACALNDIPASVWGRNLGAWVTGAVAAILMMRAGPRLLAGLLPLAALVLAGTFLGHDQSGVHRWLSLGPLSINAAMLMLPSALIPLALLGGKSLWPWLTALTCMALLSAQPDRSQASAFGVALIWIVFRIVRHRSAQIAAFVSTALLVAGAFILPDPLKPVPEVEGIFQLAYVVSPALAGGALIFLLGFSATPAWMGRRGAPATRLMGEALSVYFLVAAFMPFVGAYPVPLVGVGVSPVLGSWLAIGAFSAACSIAEKANTSSNSTN